mgnify:CR=1 FL=1
MGSIGAATSVRFTVMNCLLTGEPNEPTEAAAPQAKGGNACFLTLETGWLRLQFLGPY